MFRWLSRGLLLAVAALSVGGCLSPILIPVADFAMDPSSGESPLAVAFDASESASPNGALVEFRWDFGDGGTGQGVTTSHVYMSDAAQTLTITLRITDSEGQTASTSRSLSVLPPIEPAAADEVEFVWPFHFNASGDDAANLNDEYFALQNTGTAVVDLSGWTVENERGIAFRFPNGARLEPNAVVYVHSGDGSNGNGIYYWHASEPIWSNQSDIAILRDADGRIRTFYAYGAC